MSNIRAIRTETDYTAALARIDALMDAEYGTPEGDELDVLTDLVGLYESQHVRILKNVKEDCYMWTHKSGISFRKAEQGDLHFLQEVKVESWWGCHQVAILNYDDQERWFSNLRDTIVLIGEIPIDKEVIAQQYLGFCIISDIDWIARTASISGAVQKRLQSPEQSRKAFEAGLDFAFEMLNLHRLDAEVACFNYPARKIEIDDLGFKVEGVKRESIYKCGRYYDSLVIGMLRSEWENHPRVQAMGGSCCTNFDHELANKMIRRAERFSS